MRSTLYSDSLTQVLDPFSWPLFLPPPDSLSSIYQTILASRTQDNSEPGEGQEIHGAKTKIIIYKTYTLIKLMCYDKGKREKERYSHLNAEFQRKARKDKKASLSDQCKEIEEKNKMEKTRALFKKSRDTKGIFHENIGTIKDRNSMDLTEAKEIEKRWQEYTEETYKKDLMIQITMML